MGPANSDALPSSPCCTPTIVKGHSNETGATCYDIPSADEDCVNNALVIGTPLGGWTPSNNCNAFAQGVVKRCGGRNHCDKWYSEEWGGGVEGFDVCLHWAVPPSILPPDDSILPP